MKKSLDDSGKMKDGSASGKMIVVMWLADSGVLNKKNEDNLSDCKKSDLTIRVISLILSSNIYFFLVDYNSNDSNVQGVFSGMRNFLVQSFSNINDGNLIFSLILNLFTRIFVHFT